MRWEETGRSLAALPRAILLDLDDTILASGQRPLVLLEVAETFAADLSPFTPAQLADDLEAALEAFWSDPDRHKEARFGIAAARRKVIGEVFAAAAAGALTPALADRFAARFTEYRDLAMEFFPTARETIEALKARGTRLGLITNGAGAVQRAKIERFALAPLFDHIQIEGEVGFGKPEERAYLHAMAALGVRAEETWMVGDNLEWEVAAPQRLGIHAIWYDGLGRGLPPESAIRPDRIIQRLAQLLDGADEGLSAGGNEGRDQA